MTLEDFFTLAEMKDGLAASARVKELISVMQKEKDFVVKNIGDAMRQWCAVASTIAATNDKDCLDLFVQLDGIRYIDKWLKDAQKFNSGPSDSFAEESITALLNALEKLNIDYEKSRSYGIWMTVKNLLNHSSNRVQDRARVLFDSWKQDDDSNAVIEDVVKMETSPTDAIKGSPDLAEGGGHPKCSSRDISVAGAGADGEKQVKPVRVEMMPSIDSSVSELERVDDEPNQTSIEEKAVDHEVMKDEQHLSDLVGTSVMLEPVTENLSIKEEFSAYHLEGTRSIETCTSVVLDQDMEGKADVPESNEYTEKAMQMLKLTSFPSQLGAMKFSSVSSPVETSSILKDDATYAQDSMTKLDLENNIDKREKDRLKDSPMCDTRIVVSEGKSEMDDAGSPDHCRSTVILQNQGHDCNTNVSLDSSGNESKLKKQRPDTSFSTGDSGAICIVKEHAGDGSEDLVNDSNTLKPAIGAKDLDVVDKRCSSIELDYGMVDALEVARQVAIEVEREVVDRDLSCSSSERISGGGIRHPESSESIYNKEIQSVEAASKDLVPSESNLSAEASPKGVEFLRRSKKLEKEKKYCMQDLESSQVTDAAQEPESAEKGLGDFDLNQEVSSEDMDHLVNPISTPVPVVSSSRTAVASGLPVTPLQFEGAHGWKGSAATSAFRPASPRKFFEDDSNFVVGGSCNSSKRQDCLDFDLNVAEAGDDKCVDLVPENQNMVFSALPFGESAAEARPRKLERLNLDLNCISNDRDAPPSDWRMEGEVFYHRNDHHNQSSSSSSSIMQPALRNFNLNDQPSFYNDSSDLQPSCNSYSQNLNTAGGLQSVDPVISIMGTRVKLNQKHSIPQTPSLPNDKILDSALEVNFGRSGGVLGTGSAVPYGYPPAFGYNGPIAGPTGTLSSAMYGHAGPVTYMVDSRGVPVVPQIMGSASAFHSAYSRPPFVMGGMIGTPPASNGPGPSRTSFDLNSGLMIDGGNKDSGCLRQLFNTAQNRTFDEHLRANSQPFSGSGGFGKRKEPDDGWEPYSHYKHHQPPRK